MKYYLYPILFATIIINFSGCAQSLYLTNPSGKHNAKYKIIGLPQNVMPVDDEDSDVMSEYSGKMNEPEIEDSLARNEKSIEGPDNRKDSKRMRSSSSQQAILNEALEHCQNAHELREHGRLDDALKELDQAYFLIVDVNTEVLPGLMQQKEDIRFMISKRILEIYAVQGSVVTGKYKAIPITVNPYTQREIDFFTTGRGRKFFLEA